MADAAVSSWATEVGVYRWLTAVGRRTKWHVWEAGGSGQMLCGVSVPPTRSFEEMARDGGPRVETRIMSRAHFLEAMEERGPAGICQGCAIHVSMAIVRESGGEVDRMNWFGT